MTKTIKTILLLVIIIFSFQLFIPNTLAQDSLEFTPQVPIPGDGSPFSGGAMTVGTSKETINDAGKQVTTIYSTLLPRYIKAIYNYGIGIAAFLALAMIVAGGIIWLTSAGASDKINTAKSMITSSIIGLVLLLGTYTLLQIVSPALLSFKPIKTEYIGVLQIVCCEIDGKAQSMTNKECTKQGGDPKKGASPSSDGTQCLANGCCVLIVSDGRGRSVTNCTNTNYENCSLSAENTFSILLGKDFIDSSCSQIPKEKYNCNTEDPCEDADDGDRCGSTYASCYCYNQTPVFGPGQEGEDCGNKDGKCYADKPEDYNNITYTWDRSVRTRSCDSGLRCYYPEWIN